MSKEKTDLKCDVSSKKIGDTFAQLHHAQKTALDVTANALADYITLNVPPRAFSNVPLQI